MKPLKQLKPGDGLYAVYHWPNIAPDKSKPWAVVNLETQDINGRWHATEAEAKDQLKAMYASMGSKALKHGEMNYLQPVRNFAETNWIEGNKKWIQLYPYDSWDHPFYGTTTVDKDIASKFVENFEKGVRGQEIHTDYEHGVDPAKGNKASGKYLKVEAREDGLYGLVEFTDTAKAEIDAGEWNYWSTSHFDSWTHPQEGATYEYVIEGGGLTNKPYVKGMVPLNFSELMVENPDNVLKEHAVLSAAQRKSLPDSAYMYVAPDGTRMFPFKKSDGSLDKVHLEKIIQLAPRAKVPDNVKARVIARAKKLLGAKQNSETLVVDETDVRAIMEAEPLTDLDLEMATAITEAIDAGEDVNDENDDDEGGETVTPDELLAELRKSLGLSDDVDILAHVTEMNNEITPLRELKKEHSEKKQFSEMYPEQAQRLADLEARDREFFAREFTESISKLRVTRKTGEGDEAKVEETGLGLSALALETIKEGAKEFSEGKGNIETYKKTLDAIFDNGIVDYGTRGSSRENDEAPELDLKNAGSQDVRKAFSEKIEEIMEQDSITDFDTAYNLAATKHPELYQAYKTNKPVKSGAN